MSRCYEQLGQYCDAMLPIESWVALDPGKNDNDQTRSILRRLAIWASARRKPRQRKRRRFARKGTDVIKVDASINGVKGSFVIDTGATFVTIKKKFAEKAGLKATGQRMKLNTANGTVDGYLTKAKSVKLRSLELERVQVVIQEGDEDDFGDRTDGLIGMSFLSRFDVSMDSKALHIRPRKTK